MTFNSFTFLAFFLIVLLVHNLPLSWRTKKFNLLLASYIFYAAWNPPFVVLIWISTAVDWVVAGRMARAQGALRRRTLLVLSLLTNLGLLGFFKYGNFLLENFVFLLGRAGVTYQPPALDIVLPVGISFYTFQTLSYTFDVYRGKMKPWGSLSDFALFVTFFPQLVAGPIVRAAAFLPQCLEPRRATGAQRGWGLSLLTVGLFEKVVLADAVMARVADKAYGAAGKAGLVDAWVGTLAFSGQIFFDFAGYSTCAIGAALCLGFVLPDNFRFPYASIGFSDFWRRWHVSLSTWLRDYLYISLGGSRAGAVRTTVNLMLTMLLGGLWHGASWRFVVWGGLHGVYLALERLLRRFWGGARWLERLPVQVLLMGITYFFVCIAWVFFRAQDFSTAFTMLRAMFAGPAGHSLVERLDIVMVLAVTIGMLSGHWLMREKGLEHQVQRMPWWVRAALLALLLAGLALAPGDDRAFIYFQF